MNLVLDKLQPNDWGKMSHAAHLTTFYLDRKAEMDRIDYALLVHNQEEPCCFATLIEIDKDSVYMQHGGAFPAVAKGVYTVKGYVMITNHLKEHYKNISTKILNKNIPMIKMAIAVGLEINGVEMIDGDIFLHLMWKRPEACQ